MVGFIIIFASAFVLFKIRNMNRKKQKKKFSIQEEQICKIVDVVADVVITTYITVISILVLTEIIYYKMNMIDTESVFIWLFFCGLI
jgi:hypothetical protein